MTTSRRTTERKVRREPRYVPEDGSTLVDDRLGYLIAGFTDKGNIARPGEAFTSAMWSRDVSGTCSHEQHAKCAHRPGGGHEHGHTTTGADGQQHVWRCGCACHGFVYEPPPVLPVGQLELFPSLAGAA